MRTMIWIFETGRGISQRQRRKEQPEREDLGQEEKQKQLLRWWCSFCKMGGEFFKGENVD
jgi:hypothetical protein